MIDLLKCFFGGKFDISFFIECGSIAQIEISHVIEAIEDLLREHSGEQNLLHGELLS